MEDQDVRLMLLRSDRLTGREHAVWAAAFVRSGQFDLAAAVEADGAIKALRHLIPDELGPMTPEHAALSAGVHIAEEEFGPWYRVAWRLAMRNLGRNFREASPEQIESAHETYLRGRGDFY